MRFPICLILLFSLSGACSRPADDIKIPDAKSNPGDDSKRDDKASNPGTDDGSAQTKPGDQTIKPGDDTVVKKPEDEILETPEILPKLPLANPQTFKVLSLNVWTGGPTDLARDVKLAGAEVACLQEVSPDEAKAAMDILGAGWNLVHTHDESIGYAILSKFPLVKRLGETMARGGVGATYQINSGVRATLFCHHGNYTPYGPYQLGVDKLPAAQVIQNEKNERLWQMEELLNLMRPGFGGVDSVFLAGDFNAPSHTDYSPAVAWPVSTAVHAEGFKDSWFEKHPEKEKKSACKFLQNDPGITWARLADKEPNACFDRIDFIYYLSDVLKTLDSKTLDLASSDHRAVLSTFEVSDIALGEKASRPSPKTDSSKIARRPFLSWKKTEDAAKYDLYLGKDPALNGPAIALKDNAYAAPLLEASTVYYWRIDATDSKGKVVKGNVWNFKTMETLGISLEKTTFAPGEKIVVKFDGGTDVTDWIGVFALGSFGNVSYKYLNDTTTAPPNVVSQGKVNLLAPTKSGSYFIKSLSKDSYKDTDLIEIKVP